MTKYTQDLKAAAKAGAWIICTASPHRNELVVYDSTGPRCPRPWRVPGTEARYGGKDCAAVNDDGAPWNGAAPDRGNEEDPLKLDLSYDALIVRPDGEIDWVKDVARRPGDPVRITTRRGGLWVAADCRAPGLNDMEPSSWCHDPLPVASGMAGYVVGCRCTRLWGGSNWVRTPCCDKGQRFVGSGDTVVCPSAQCGWFWTVVIAPGGTRWISKGYGRTIAPKKRRK